MRRLSSTPGRMRPPSRIQWAPSPSPFPLLRCSTINSSAITGPSASLAARRTRYARLAAPRSQLSPHSRSQVLEPIGTVEGLGGADPGKALTRQPNLQALGPFSAREVAERLDQVGAYRPAAPLGMHPEILNRAVAAGHVDRVLPAGGEDADDRPTVLAPCLRHQQGTRPPVPGKLSCRLLKVGRRGALSAQLDQQLRHGGGDRWGILRRGLAHAPAGTGVAGGFRLGGGCPVGHG